MRVKVEPSLFVWARERAEKSLESLGRAFPKLAEWESAASEPTLAQLENYARATYTSVGFFFLSGPPNDSIPIPDFRTVRNEPLDRPSANLLDTIYICERRQEWYRDYCQSQGIEPPSFVGALTADADIVEAASTIRRSLNCDVDVRRRLSTWEAALRELVAGAEGCGILVMVSGIVGNNTHRHLNTSEFRGFALADSMAPLVFVNGADSKSAQMFTLVHEVAHLWLGSSSLDNVDPKPSAHDRIEDWCNQVAGEVLVPLATLKAEFRPDEALTNALSRLSRYFKISTLVVLRRMHTAQYLSAEEFWREYERELERLLKISGTSGGNFHLSEAVRVSKRFASALVASTLEGQTLYREALHLLSFSKVSTFQSFAESLGFEMSDP